MEANIAKRAQRAGTEWGWGNSYANSIFADVPIFYSVCFFILKKKRQLEGPRQCPFQTQGSTTAGLIPPGRSASQALPSCGLDVGLAEHLLDSGLINVLGAVHVLIAKLPIICLTCLAWKVVIVQPWALELTGCSLH